MGSTDYFHIVHKDKDNPTATAAFDRLSAEGFDYYGHQEGYAGHIGLSGGFVLHRGSLVSQPEAERIAGKYQDDHGKYDPAVCVPFGVSKVSKRTVTRVLHPANDYTPRAEDEIVVAAAKLQPGERIVRVEVLESSAGEPKVKVARNRGKASRVFVLKKGSGVFGQFDSFDAAAAAARDRVADQFRRRETNSHVHVDEGEFTISERVQRDGQPAGKVVVSFVRRVKVKIFIERDVSVPSTVTGWIFAGWARS